MSLRTGGPGRRGWAALRPAAARPPPRARSGRPPPQAVGARPGREARALSPAVEVKDPQSQGEVGPHGGDAAAGGRTALLGSYGRCWARAGGLLPGGAHRWPRPPSPAAQARTGPRGTRPTGPLPPNWPPPTRKGDEVGR